MDEIKLLISLGTAAGFGGVIGSYFQMKFGRQAKQSDHQHELKQKRYLCILMLMLAKIDDEKSLGKLTQFRPDLRSIEDLDNELQTELLNAVVYSSDSVLKNLSSFISTPNKESFYEVASAIRTDLWGKNSQLSGELKSILSKV